MPLYKTIYDLNLYFYKLSRGFPKDFKYSLGQEIKNNLTNLLDKIVIANNSQNKGNILSEAIVLGERIKIKNRLLKDLGIIKLSSYKFFSQQLIEVSKQLEKWLIWSKRDES